MDFANNSCTFIQRQNKQHFGFRDSTVLEIGSFNDEPPPPLFFKSHHHLPHNYLQCFSQKNQENVETQNIQQTQKKFETILETDKHGYSA